MFEFIRTHQRLMQFLLLLLILPSFVFVGVSQYNQRGGNDGVATVDGHSITQQEWETAQRRQIDEARQQLGARFDQKAFDTPEAKQAVLDNLVAQRAVNVEVAREHLGASDMAVAKATSAIPGLSKPDGSFDMAQYRAWVAAQGMTPDMFDADMRHRIAVQQLAGSIEQTAFTPKSVSNRLLDFASQVRQVQELQFPAAQYVAQVKVTDDMVKAYYDKHPNQYTVPEHVKADYLVFDAAAVAKQVTVTDAEVADAYNKTKARYATVEKRSASQILINAPKDAKPADDAAAKAKADAILAEVRKNPNDFAKIAKAQSQDPGSAELGGDLGDVGRGVLPAKQVEDAIYSLKDGEISNVVKSDFGYHIVKLTKLVPATQKSLDEVKTQVADEVRKTKMNAKYTELAEAFSNIVEDQSDSLKAAADKFGLTIQTADGLTRAPNPALGASPVNNEKFLKAIFSNDALVNKRNTQAVEVAPSTLVAGHVVALTPAAKRPMAEVDAVIRKQVAQEEAVRLARQAGEAKLAAAKNGDAAGFGETKSLSRTEAPSINPAAALAVFNADVAKLPAVIGVDLPGQGYGVYRITAVTQPAKVDEALRKGQAEQIARASGAGELVDYVDFLKHKAKAKINVKAADLGSNAQ